MTVKKFCVWDIQKMKMKDMQRINFYVSKIQIVKLKEISDKTGLSVSEHVRRAIDEYMKYQTGEEEGKDETE